MSNFVSEEDKKIKLTDIFNVLVLLLNEFRDDFFVLVVLSDMDESMNSVHSISAMDISPASSPRTTMNTIPPNPSVLSAFQQQQELLFNMLSNRVDMSDYPLINKNPLSDEYENQSKSVCLYSTVLTENNEPIQSPILPDESNQLRQRMITASVPSVIESPSTHSQSVPSKRSFQKIALLLIPIVLFIIYLMTQSFYRPILLPRASHWQNASEYLTKNLIGQEQGLQEFKETVEKHKNFSIVLLQVKIDDQ